MVPEPVKRHDPGQERTESAVRSLERKDPLERLAGVRARFARPSRRKARDASVALKIFVHHPKMTLATKSASNRHARFVIAITICLAKLQACQPRRAVQTYELVDRWSLQCRRRGFAKHCAVIDRKTSQFPEPVVGGNSRYRCRRGNGL